MASMKPEFGSLPDLRNRHLWSYQGVFLISFVNLLVWLILALYQAGIYHADESGVLPLPLIFASVGNRMYGIDFGNTYQRSGFSFGFMVQPVTLGVLNLAYGLVFLVLGFLVRSRRVIALKVAIPIFCLVWIISVAVIATPIFQSGDVAVGIMTVVFMALPRYGILRVMIRGISAIEALKLQS